jgi:soluble lytic murein transglycosylase-like protein
MMAISEKVLKWQHVVEMWARLTKVPTWLLYATIQQESGGNENATRFEPGYLKTYCHVPKFIQIQKKTLLTPEEIATSYGLMQLMLPLAWGYLSDSQRKPYIKDVLLDPSQNVRFGAAHLGTLLKKLPDLSDHSIAVVAGRYNGAGANSSYARNIVALCKQYKEAGR